MCYREYTEKDTEREREREGAFHMKCTQKRAIFDRPDLDFDDFWCISTSIHAKSKSEKKIFLDPPNKN